MPKESSGLPEGESEGTYVFLSGDLPPQKSFPIRYDAARELKITAGNVTAVMTAGTPSADGKTVQSGPGMITPERIPLVVFTEGTNTGIVFEKKDLP